jgi:hypothetical protein
MFADVHSTAPWYYVLVPVAIVVVVAVVRWRNRPPG